MSDPRARPSAPLSGESDRPEGPAAEREGSRGYRQRQRALERARRRRRLARRLSVVGALLLLVAGAFGIANLLQDDQEGVTEAAAAQPRLILLLLTEAAEGASEEVPVVVLLGAGTDPTMVLGLPGNTLLEGPEGFDPLVELLRDYGPDALDLGIVLAETPEGSASLAWTDLRGLLSATEGGAELPESLDTSPESAEMAAQALALAVAMSADEEGRGRVEELSLDGDGEAFFDALRDLAPAPAVVGGLPGKQVEGVGYAYFEPDLSGIQRLLGGEAPESKVEVEVQNGSGVAGIAQRVNNALEPLSYSLLPAKNAEDFPNVQETKIVAAPNVVPDAERIRQALGAGTVVPRESLPANRIVIIVGKDMPVEGLPAAEDSSTDEAPATGAPAGGEGSEAG